MAPYAQPPTEVNPPRGFNMIHVKADDPRRGVAAVTHVPVTHVLRCEACGKILCEVANYLWVDAGGLATVDIDCGGCGTRTSIIMTSSPRMPAPKK